MNLNQNNGYTANSCSTKAIIIIKEVNEAIQLDTWWQSLDISSPTEIYSEIVEKFKNNYDQFTVTIKLGKQEIQNSWFNHALQQLVSRFFI